MAITGTSATLASLMTTKTKAIPGITITDQTQLDKYHGALAEALIEHLVANVTVTVTTTTPGATPGPTPLEGSGTGTIT